MKKTLFLLVITLTVVISTARAAQDTNSTDMEKRVRELQKKSMKSRPSNINRQRRNAELESLQGLSREERRERIRQLRTKRMKEMEAERNKNRGIVPPKAAMEQTQTLEKLKTQLAQEDKKHLKRLAKLNRIKVLATESNSQKTLARVDKLIAKEQRRSSNKRRRLQERQRMLERIKARGKEMRSPDKQALTRKAIEKAHRERYPEPKNTPRP